MRARRAEWQDAFTRGDESVVMAGSNVVRLSPVATYLLDQMSSWRTVDELAAALVEQFGEPIDGTAADFVATTLTELVALEIVLVEP